MSDTPITDAHAHPMEGFADQWVPRHISEELERELAEIKKKHKKVLDILAEVLDDWFGEWRPSESTSYRRATALLQES
jgi:hypothetical protein